MNNNPLLSKFETPFGLPPFEQIQNAHFKPAFLEAFERHKAEIKAIVEQSEAPSFENTIVALDRAGGDLNQIASIFYNLNSAHTDDEKEALATEIAPLVSAHSDAIYLNPALFERVEKVWESRNDLKLDPVQSQLLETTYKKFVRSGAKVKDNARLMEINSRLAVLSTQFSQNVLAETNEYKLVVEDSSRLQGLPKQLIASAAKASGSAGKWQFGLQNASVMPFLQYAEDRALRQEIWQAYKNRAGRSNTTDNQALVKEMVALRAERAKILGYDNHAAFVLEERMAQNLDGVEKLLNQLWAPALQAAKREWNALNELAQASGQKDDVAAWDWRFYEEKLRLQKFDLDARELMPYFSLENTREGIFQVCQKLYGLQFKERTDLPKYQADVQVYEVLDKDNSHIGILYMDLLERPSKRGGAWMTSFREQSYEQGKRLAPVISIVCNFPQPSDESPSLLSFDEVTTFFHEFGHALHGLLSDVPYESLAGTSVPTDFVELPSQIMENWAAEPEVLKQYAKHYQTGEVIPDSLIRKLQNSGTFGQGFATVEYLASTFLDLAYHRLDKGFEQPVEAFENQALKDLGLFNAIIPRHRSLYFQHVFAGGYSAGYYSYIWSGVLDSDAFEVFKQKGLFDAPSALAFRKEVLERGGSRPAMELYRNFRGSEPDIRPLLRKRGLLGEAVSKG